jgi:hypothetical protein
LGSGSALLVHAGAIFDTRYDFILAVKEDQESSQTKVVMHKGYFNTTHGAYICSETKHAIVKEGVASTTDDPGVKDRQWWRHVCGGACGFVAQGQQARPKVHTTMLSDLMQEPIQDHLLAAAPCEIGVNGVRKDQWVVTLFAPHTCAAAVDPATQAAPAAANAAPAAAAAVESTVTEAASAFTAEAAAHTDYFTDDPSESEEEAAPPRQATGLGSRGLLTEQGKRDREAARLPVLSVGDGAGDVPLLRAGAVFNSLEDVRQAVQQDPELSKCEVVVHKAKIANRAHGAYICRETHKAIQEGGLAWSRDDQGAQDRQWWQHVCDGACGFVAEVQQASEQKRRTTKLRATMQDYIDTNPLAASPCQVGVNGVKQGQWVITIYAPHTCVDAAVSDSCSGGSKATAARHAAPANVQMRSGRLGVSGTSGASAAERSPSQKLAKRKHSTSAAPLFCPAAAPSPTLSPFPAGRCNC